MYEFWGILTLSLSLMSPAFAEDSLRVEPLSSIEDSVVDTTHTATLDDYFEKSLPHEGFKYDAVLLPIAPIVAGYGIQWWLVRSRANFLSSASRAKIMRNSIYRGLNVAGAIYLFVDSVAGVYVYIKGYKPKFLGNLPALVSYLAKNPEGLENFAKEIDPGAKFSKLEQLEIESDYAAFHSGVVRAFNSPYDSWVRE